MNYRDDYSQHFLQNISLVKELIGHSDIKKSDTVLDIGAGSGVITSALVSKAKSIIAVENEPAALKRLRINTKDLINVEIIETDILEMALPKTPYKVFSNIPFHLSSPILRMLTEGRHPPDSIYLILQKQFARKLLLESDFFHGMLGAQIAPFYTSRIRKYLKRTDYWPPPKVDTVLLELQRRSEPLVALNAAPKYRKFVEKSFHDPNFFALTRNKDIKHEKPSQFRTNDWIKSFSSHIQRPKQ